MGNGRTHARKPRKLNLKTRGHQMLWHWLQQEGNTQSGLARAITEHTHGRDYKPIPKINPRLHQSNIGKWLGGMMPRANVFRAIEEITGIPASAWSELADEDGPRARRRRAA